jgi:hypothetical protein
MFMSSGEGLPEPGEGLGRREHGPVPASLEDTMSQFAEYVVNRLFSVGLSLESARSIVGEGAAGDRVAAAAGEVDRMIRDIRTITFGRAADRGNHAPDRWPVPPGGHGDRTRKLLDGVVNSISEVGALVQAAADLPRDATRPRMTEALRRLDDLALEVRDHVSTDRGAGTEPGPAWKTPLGGQERSVPSADRAALLQERMARTARTLQAAAADYAALLEQRADLTRKPGRVDYPAEIKRWRAFAGRAEHMAKRWEQPPQPEAPPGTGQDRD